MPKNEIIKDIKRKTRKEKHYFEISVSESNLTITDYILNEIY